MSAAKGQRLTETRVTPDPRHVILDEDGDVGRAMMPRPTPHMYVICRQRTGVYRGAIDSIPSARTSDIPGRQSCHAALDALANPAGTPSRPPPSPMAALSNTEPSTGLPGRLAPAWRRQAPGSTAGMNRSSRDRLGVTEQDGQALQGLLWGLTGVQGIKLSLRLLCHAAENTGEIGRRTARLRPVAEPRGRHRKARRARLEPVGHGTGLHCCNRLLIQLRRSLPPFA